MNIHFTNNILFQELMESTIFQIEVGSGMYNLKTTESDTDILCIYLEGSLNLTSLTQTHHQLQYKDIENNNDYIFTSLTQFVKNILSGDSTINYEVLQSTDFKTKFPDLFNSLNFKITNIEKSYLGMAKRDLKSYRKQPSNKKLYHIIRGIEFAESIDSGEDDIYGKLNQIHDDLKLIREDDNRTIDTELIESYENMMNTLRVHLKDIPLTDRQIYFIDYFIREVYIKNKDIQKDFIDYNTLIIDAVYSDKFGY